jgi:hypothetical protein
MEELVNVTVCAKAGIASANAKIKILAIQILFLDFFVFIKIFHSHFKL